MYFIDVADNQSALPVDEAFVRDVVERTLAAEEVASAEISVALVDDEAIRELNVRYLAHDYATDVLSFLLECSVGEAQFGESHRRGSAGAGGGFRPRGRGKRIEGEVIVSTETAVDRAGEFGWSARDELVLYLVHGTLHLAGYDDTTDAERALMRSREAAILALWDLVPSHGDEEEDAPSADSPDREGEP